MIDTSMIKLPIADENLYKDEIVKNNIKTLLINEALKTINNTILKDYITKDEVIKNINTYAEKIEVKKGFDFLEDPIYSYNTLFLEPYFFTQTMKNINNINSDLFEYPDLLKISEVIGLTTAFANSDENMCFIIGTSSTKDEYIKGLIANYFATSYKNNDIKEVNYAGKKFATYGTIKCLQLNMISIIALIIGEDSLAEVLVSRQPEQTLAQKIDIITKRKGFGYKFIKQMHSLEKNIKSLEFFLPTIEKDNNFYEEKIKPLIDVLQKYDDHTQLFISSYLENNNYDINQWITILPTKAKEFNFHFNENDIEYIKTLEKSYKEHEKESMKIGKGHLFFSCLATEVPKISSRDGYFYMEDLTFLNKVVTEFNINKVILKEKIKKVDEAVISIIDLLSEKIIPYAIRNSRIALNQKQLEEITLMMTYDNSEITMSKKGQRQMQKVKKKIDKNKK